MALTKKDFTASLFGNKKKYVAVVEDSKHNVWVYEINTKQKTAHQIGVNQSVVKTTTYKLWHCTCADNTCSRQYLYHLINEVQVQGLQLEKP